MKEMKTERKKKSGGGGMCNRIDHMKNKISNLEDKNFEIR